MTSKKHPCLGFGLGTGAFSADGDTPDGKAKFSSFIGANGCLSGPEGSPINPIAVLTGTGLLSTKHALINSNIS